MSTRARLMILGFWGCLLLLAPGCIFVSLFRPTSPVLYKPSGDLEPVLTLRLPEHIDTLAGIPRTETIVENGFNKLIGEQEVGRSDARRELFYLRKGGALKEGSTEYQFFLFHTEAAATEEYGWAKLHRRVFREATENGLNGRLYYTEEPRADPEGGSAPMGYYISRADFRLRNLYIRVEARDNESPHNDKLTRAVGELAQMLRVTLVRTNKVPQ